MFLGYFTERPYQDPDAGISGAFLTEGGQLFAPGDAPGVIDLGTSNGLYNPRVAHQLYNRYLDEKVYAEEMGFDGLMLNEHHASLFCMGGAINVEAAILARITKRAKIVLLGNVLPIWDDPMWLAEELAEIDLISGGRLVPGWVRGTGRESVAHNAQSPFNWERFQEAHDFVIKTWTTDGPFRWEGKHFQYRYVNPWSRPMQQPHPPIWIPGTLSKNTLRWAAEHRYPYIMLGGELDAVRESFDYYRECASNVGYEAGPEHFGYVIKVHVEESDDQAYEVGRKYLQGPSNPFIEGNQGEVRQHLQSLPGLSPRKGDMLPMRRDRAQARARGVDTAEAPPKEEKPRVPQAERDFSGSYDKQIERFNIVVGSPETVIERMHHVVETLQLGSVFLWDGDGAMSHEDAISSLTLMGKHVLPAMRQIGDDLNLPGPYDFDPPRGSVG
ncbi:MAG: LLM class flavin-dependent oxidoreductase [Chloroflexi bacterium]|nr:LLM class flavin-dependent oxidoreductase [Chloroflexota bacterium]